MQPSLTLPRITEIVRAAASSVKPTMVARVELINIGLARRRSG